MGAEFVPNNFNEEAMLVALFIRWYISNQPNPASRWLLITTSLTAARFAKRYGKYAEIDIAPRRSF